MRTRTWINRGAAALLLSLGALLPAQTATSPALDPALVARAQAGDAAAEVQVGQAYAAGKGVAQDGAQALTWLRKAADKGSLEAFKALATLYRDGAGKDVPRDPVQAVAWLKKAAELGDVESQGMLGIYYSYGQGVKQDHVEAYYWLDLAAAVAGPKQAQYAANRQMVGVHITAEELKAVQARVAKWKAAHPR